MGYLSINVELSGRTCLVVGGGSVGERKVIKLIGCGATVRIVSRELSPALAAMVDRDEIEYAGREYQARFMDGAALVFVATNDSGLNEQVSRDARERGLWVNVADRPGFCSFILPATLARGDLAISVSTGGKSPALAARIRRELEDRFGDEYAIFLTWMGRIREKVLQSGRSNEENRRIFKRLVESDLIEVVASGDTERLERRLLEILGPDYSSELTAAGMKSAPPGVWGD